MTGRFSRYVEKVFSLARLAANQRDGRDKPQIPTCAVFLCVLMMNAMRLRSLNALEGELRLAGRWEKIVGKRKPSADSLARIVALMDCDPLRDALSEVNHRMRRKKILGDSPWALRFVDLDAHEFFPSRKRYCPQCCRREIIVGKKGKKRKVTEFYHRAVVAHLTGFSLPVVLDVEPILAGEGEIAAAKRLLQRLMQRYARFFDAVQGDALYWEAPLLDLCRKHGKHLLAVLKDNNPALLADAQALLSGQPDLVREDEDGRHVRYWDQEEFTSGAAATPVRVVRTEETWTRNERVAGRTIQTRQVSNWFWATSIPKSTIPARQLARIGHERWKIENSVFNALARDWAMDHCYHHQPAAILNFLLILFIAHILVACLHSRNLKKQARRIYSTLISLADAIRCGIVLLKARDIPWARAPASPPNA